ncbi:hypothetical protein SDRG_08079 [Saprolegnia diclina VS20]|uniref:TNFR-Cys domain-containing protein n=1 Tax=Saprolegnia diclina (strain VS20) TaxID=1156394 RepID=T0QHS4_SAPDV|nr:hypothetical protein SDRG_08079 [Saprolegnia diclina VS20]EQC34306.1 hypothetical protein SDRG_08079 [Saprolegnia diclina VS20]|eukprot:XP_008612168.1 hypothetical protein SDRG_08079 [Saprolegnia diclina VS20]
MKLLLQLATALLLLAASDAKTTPAVCKNKTCVTASGDTCDRSTSTSCGACMSVSDSGTVSCKDTNFFGLCSSSTKCGTWSSTSSGSGSGSGTGNTTTTAPVSTTESPQSPQPTQPTQPPQPTQRPSDQTTTPAPTDDASSATAEPTAAPATSPPSSSTNWALYGGIGGGVVGLFLIIGIACCIIRKRRNDEDDDDDVGHYANKAQSTPPAQVAIPMTTMATQPAPPMYAVPEPAPVFALPISPRSSSSNTSLPRTSAMSGYEVATNPLVNFVARASVETDTAPYRQTIAQKFNHLENFNEGVGSDSESDSSSFHRQRTSTDGSFNMSDGSNDSFVITRTEDDRKENGTACSVEF